MNNDQYRKKPVVIEAFQFRSDWATATVSFPRWAMQAMADDAINLDDEQGCALIATPEGVMKANNGDWIIKGVKGEFYPCKPDIFAASYEAVGESQTTPPESAVTQAPKPRDSKQSTQDAIYLLKNLHGTKRSELEEIAAVAFFLDGFRQSAVASETKAAIERHNQHVKDFMAELSEYLGMEDGAKPADYLKAASDMRQKMSDWNEQLAAQSLLLSRAREALAALIPIAEIANDVEPVGAPDDNCGVNRANIEIDSAKVVLSALAAQQGGET